MKKQFEEAHRCSIRHRRQLEKDKICGCFHCLAIFHPNEITEWIDDNEDDTALCPFCGIDSVIGESSGFPITKEFLEGMHHVWF